MSESLNKILQDLSPWKSYQNQIIARAAIEIDDCTKKFREGKISRDEFEDLLNDVDIMKKMAACGDEMEAAREINGIIKFVKSVL